MHTVCSVQIDRKPSARGPDAIRTSFTSGKQCNCDPLNDNRMTTDLKFLEQTNRSTAEIFPAAASSASSVKPQFNPAQNTMWSLAQMSAKLGRLATAGCVHSAASSESFCATPPLLLPLAPLPPAAAAGTAASSCMARLRFPVPAVQLLSHAPSLPTGPRCYQDCHCLRRCRRPRRCSWCRRRLPQCGRPCRPAADQRRALLALRRAGYLAGRRRRHLRIQRSPHQEWAVIKLMTLVLVAPSTAECPKLYQDRS